MVVFTRLTGESSVSVLLPTKPKASYFHTLHLLNYKLVTKSLWKWILTLTHLFLMHPFSTAWKHQKTVRFLIFSGGRERVHWEKVSWCRAVKLVPKGWSGTQVDSTHWLCKIQQNLLFEWGWLIHRCFNHCTMVHESMGAGIPFIFVPPCYLFINFLENT